MTDPRKVMIAGDWHGNRLWAASAIRQGCEKLGDEPRKVILQLGDFGVWRPPGEEKWTFAGREYSRESYLSAVDRALEENGAELWFIDGNHENHPLLHKLCTAGGVSEYSWITPRIRWLLRGLRWEWHGRTWLACGGAVSVDKMLRKEGISWFPEEEITSEQEKMILMDGKADVMLCHDAPTCNVLPLGDPPREWLPMIPAAQAHRERLQRICEAVQPSWLFHGHYHLHQRRRNIPVPWGRCDFTSLDMDGTQGNWEIWDIEKMAPEEEP